MDDAKLVARIRAEWGIGDGMASGDGANPATLAASPVRSTGGWCFGGWADPARGAGENVLASRRLVEHSSLSVDTCFAWWMLALPWCTSGWGNATRDAASGLPGPPTRMNRAWCRICNATPADVVKRTVRADATEPHVVGYTPPTVQLRYEFRPAPPGLQRYPSPAWAGSRLGNG